MQTSLLRCCMFCLILVVWSASAEPLPSECRWGASYWCRSQSAAKRCGRVDYCQTNVWRKVRKLCQIPSHVYCYWPFVHTCQTPLKFIAFPYNLWYMYTYPWDMRAHNHGHLWQLFHHPHNVSSTVVYYSVCMTSGLYVNCKVCPRTNVMIIGTQNKPMIRTNKKLTFLIRW